MSVVEFYGDDFEFLYQTPFFLLTQFTILLLLAESVNAKTRILYKLTFIPQVYNNFVEGSVLLEPVKTVYPVERCKEAISISFWRQEAHLFQAYADRASY